MAELIIKKINPELNIRYEELPEDDPIKRKPDIDLAKQLLGWEPKTSLSEGMDLTINYFRNL